MNNDRLSPLAAFFHAVPPTPITQFGWECYTNSLPLLEAFPQERQGDFDVLVQAVNDCPDSLSRLACLLKTLTEWYALPSTGASDLEKFNRAAALTLYARYLRRTGDIHQAIALLKDADALYEGYNKIEDVKQSLMKFEKVDLWRHQTQSQSVMEVVRGAAATATELALCYAIDTRVYQKSDDWWLTRWCLTRAVQLENCVLSYTLATNPESERLRYLQVLDEQEALLLTLVAQDIWKEHDRAYKVMMQRKGISVEVFGWMNETIFGDSSDAYGRDKLEKVYQEYVRVAREVEAKGMKLLIGRYRSPQSDAVQQQLFKQLTDLEVELSRYIPKSFILEYLETEQPRQLLREWKLFSDTMALVDFVRYRTVEFNAPLTDAPVAPPAERYMAFVLRKTAHGGELITAVPLPQDATHIEQTLRQWRTVVLGETDEARQQAAELAATLSATNDSTFEGSATVAAIEYCLTTGKMRGSFDPEAGVLGDGRVEGQRLHDALIAPLMPHLGGIQHLIISPDAELAQLPFQALVDGAGEYLVHRYCISYTNSPRDLLKWKGSSYAKSPSSAPPLIIADPNYDYQTTHDPKPDSPFNELKYTADEGKEIANLCVNAVLKMADEATESLITSSSQPPRLLHFATHGFAAPGLEELRRAFGNTVTGGLPSTAGRMQDPLLRTGLALTGANTMLNTKSYRTDLSISGVLTGAKIKNLNLRGTEMAVLSACDTGLGDIVAGEGVFGLRRAFAIAGVSTLILSLWKVNDKITYEMMVAFYTALKAGKARGEALWETQRTFATTYPNTPALWAAFICDGDPGTLTL